MENTVDAANDTPGVGMTTTKERTHRHGEPGAGLVATPNIRKDTPMRLCDEKCNECPILRHRNGRMVSVILNAFYHSVGHDAYAMINKLCPNMTVCHDCRIDDFCHDEGCEIDAKAIQIDREVQSKKVK
jgi:hypothetical protein